MDLGAYMQIDNLDKIAADNGIVVPRLRGYRLMIDENPVSEKEINELVKEATIDICKNLCCSEPFWCPDSNSHLYSWYTQRLEEYYMSGIRYKNEYGTHVKFNKIRWDRIHGRKRKILKFAIRKLKKNVQKQYDMWNKYAGKDNILYIHARIGGWNWQDYGDELAKQPWFICKIDDYYDDTYCDIYASLK